MLKTLSLSPGATFNNLLARNCEGVERERERGRDSTCRNAHVAGQAHGIRTGGN